MLVSINYSRVTTAPDQVETRVFINEFYSGRMIMSKDEAMKFEAVLAKGLEATGGELRVTSAPAGRTPAAR